MKYTYEKRKKIYDDGLKKWGYVAQFDQTVEEMAELTQAICKYKRQLSGEYSDRKDIIDNMLEEIADVYMCIEFLQILLGEQKFNEVLDNKIAKFEKQIQDRN